MLFYRAALPLSRQTLSYVAGVIRRHRRVTWHGRGFGTKRPAPARTWSRRMPIRARLEQLAQRTTLPPRSAAMRAPNWRPTAPWRPEVLEIAMTICRLWVHEYA
jgi:hypothetical protein